MVVLSTSKCVLVLCLLIYTVSLVASDESKDAPNDACSEDIRALRQELQILRQELRMQRKRIEKFEKELATTSEYSRDSRSPKQNHFSTKRDEYKDEILLEHNASRNYENYTNPSKRTRLPRQPKSMFNNVNIQLERITRLKRDDTQRISFYANTVKDSINLDVHHTLIFGNVITNDGNCYRSSSGHFRPNLSGVYVFHVQILQCYSRHTLRTELVVEGVVKAGHYTGDSTNCSNGGGMAIVHVKAGDSVWVRVQTSDGVNRVAWESSFAGFLLYPRK